MADQNIDLGSITWDLSSIDKQILENRKQLQGYSEALKFNKEALKQQSKQIQDAAKTIVFLEQMQKELNAALQEGTISEEEYMTGMQNVNSELQATRESTAEVIKIQSELIQSNIEIERSVKDLQQETRTLNTLRAAGREEAYDEIGAYQALNDELNALKRESKDLGATLLTMKNNGEENTAAYKALEERYKSVTERASELNEEFVRLDSAVGDNQRNVGNYTESIKNAFSGITEGFNKMLSGNVQEGLGDIKDGLKGIKDTASDLFKTIAANPWAAVLTVIVGGLVAYTREVIQHNQYISEANKKVEDLAHTTGALTDELRRAGEAITDTFENKSFEDAITEMDRLMDDFKISSQEAWDIYTEGLARGGAANGEFGDSIKEYGSQFAKNGYSAQQFINILNSGIDLGIYSDKLPDAINEAGRAINEQTKSARDALINAFGAPFTDDILKRVQNGRITIAQALDEISKKAEKSNLDQQQQAQLTADLFKGAGEDAAGAMTIFEALNKAQNTSSANLTDLQKQTIRLAELNLELQKSKDAAFSNTSVRAFSKELEIFGKKNKIIFNQLIAQASFQIKSLLDFTEFSFKSIAAALASLPALATSVFKGIGADIINLSRIAITAGGIITKALGGDIEGAKENYRSLGSLIENFSSQSVKALSDYKNSVLKTTADIAGSIAERNKALAEIQKQEQEAIKKAEKERETVAEREAAEKARLEAQKKADAEAKKAETKRLAEAKKAVADAKKEAEDLAKREIELQKDRVNQATEIAKGELAEYIRINAEKYKDDKRITDAKLKDQLAYFDEVSKKQKESNRLEKEASILNLQIKVDELEKKKELNQTELSEVENLKSNIAILNSQYAEKDAEIEQLASDKKKEITKKYNSDILEQEKLARAILFQQKILDLEAQGDQEFEIQRTKLQEQYADEIEIYLEKNQRLVDADLENYDVLEDIDNIRRQIEEEQQATTDEKERLRLQNQLDSLSLIQEQYAENSKKIDEAVNQAKLQGLQSAFGMAKGLFKENTLAYKAMAIAEATISTYLAATKALAEVPFPINYVVMGANIAAGLAQVAKIVGVKGFSAGGYTGDGGVNDIAGLVHKGEVVWSQADVKAMGGAAVVDAMRPTAGGYFGSTVGVSNMPSVQSAMMGGNIVVMLDEDSVSLIADATYAGSRKGIGDMADNTDIRIGANFG